MMFSMLAQEWQPVQIRVTSGQEDAPLATPEHAALRGVLATLQTCPSPCPGPGPYPSSSGCCPGVRVPGSLGRDHRNASSGAGGLGELGAARPNPRRHGRGSQSPSPTPPSLWGNPLPQGLSLGRKSARRRRESEGSGQRGQGLGLGALTRQHLCEVELLLVSGLCVGPDSHLSPQGGLKAVEH